MNETRSQKKVPIYAWQEWNDNTSSQSLEKQFNEWRSQGIEGICFNAHFDVEKTSIAAKAAKKAGLIYHAWVPCMLQPDRDKSWYAVNRLGQPAWQVQAYVKHYTCMDPHNPEVQNFLVDKCKAIAAITEVDFIQLDYIRYADVILPIGLWPKYGLVMNEEYPTADYCYCDSCTSDFKRHTGIDIKAIKDPSKCKEWAQFRYDVITSLVNKISDAIHTMGKKISADVFPGPDSYAKKMVRQEWDKWHIDAFFPMHYNDFYLKPPEWTGEMTHEGVQSLNGRVPLYSGLCICPYLDKSQAPDLVLSGLTPTELKIAITSSLDNGATGICLFTADRLTPQHWQVLSGTIKKWTDKHQHQSAHIQPNEPIHF